MQGIGSAVHVPRAEYRSAQRKRQRRNKEQQAGQRAEKNGGRMRRSQRLGKAGRPNGAA